MPEDSRAGIRAAARIRAAQGSNDGRLPPQRSTMKAIPNTIRYGIATPSDPTGPKNGRQTVPVSRK